LRSHHKYSPFPEEINRRIASVAADLHFAPTDIARDNLLREGVPSTSITVTGNTVVDALLWMRKKVKQENGLLPEDVKQALGRRKHMVLVTGHRRENFGKGFEAICLALRMLADVHPDVLFLYPVHLNPQVQEPVRRLLSDHPGIFLTAPFSYKPFVRLMEKATLILTDSGGIQEEATILGKPVLVMRETTERPEGVTAGAAQLVGADTDNIVHGVSALLASPALRQKMASAGTNLYGDGNAAIRIVRSIVAAS